jgi:hypothetical protein
MGSNYTVIIRRRQHFGVNPNIFDGEFPHGVPSFVGLEQDYTFDCPDVDPVEIAVLFYNAYAVHSEMDSPLNRFEINGGQLYGGLYPQSGSAGYSLWATQELLVEPEFGLKETGNVLHVAASAKTSDFILDNIVIMYKTASRHRVEEG